MNGLKVLMLVSLSTGVLGLMEKPTLANPILQGFCQGVIVGAQITGDFSAIPEDCYPYLPRQSRPVYQDFSESTEDYIRRENRRADQIERRNQMNLDLLQDPPGVCLSCGPDPY